MVKIFRKYRQQQLTDKGFGKYLLYAVGEITLIVIGILIAIQLNNWNENRKSRIQEVKTLKELRSDLVQSLNDIEMNLNVLRTCRKSNEIIKHCIVNKIPYADTLNRHFANLYPYITFSVNETTYSSLQQSGLSLISNDSLRISISDIYANQFGHFRSLMNDYMIEHYENYMKPMFITEFITYDYPEEAIPKDYNLFIQNNNHEQITNFSLVICNTFIRILQTRLKPNVEELINEIDKEISN